MTWLEVAGWLIYLIPTMMLFSRPQRRPAQPAERPVELPAQARGH